MNDKKLLTHYLKDFCSYFKVPIKKIWEWKITKIAPTSSRSYASYYNYRAI